MGYRHIMIENPVELSVSHGQLCVHTEQGTASFPLEDLDAILLENRKSRITSAALAALAASGCAVFFCDERHLPCGILQPFQQHSRQSGVLSTQLSCTVPQKKRLWQQIVKQKIRNQAICLRECGKTEPAERLQVMANGVLSGDTSNVEGAAAAYYFPKLFGEGFLRGDEMEHANAALDYGYAILRGMIARTLSVHGLQPSFGLQHHSTLNAFNLADDLIEPFRPVVDLYVGRKALPPEGLTSAVKRELVDLLNMDMQIRGQKNTVSHAMEQTVQSLLRCMKGEEKELLLPVLLPLQRHRYE